jgi:hypothetical protein
MVSDDDVAQKALASSSWTSQSLGVLQRACDHYGGFDTWHALRKIRLIPDRLSGLVPWLRGNERTFRISSTMEIQPHERRARFLNYPDMEHVGIYDNGAVRLARSDTNEVVVQADDHRQSFRGLAKNRRWTPLDALYFFGYALTHYHSLPFSLYDAQLIRASEIGSRSDRLSVLHVNLPATLHTHCRRQSFYFDQAGRLTRHDYHAEIVGFWARGAHFWNRQICFAGFPVSLDRHVVPRLGAYACPGTALHATFVDAEVELGRAPSPGKSSL